MVKPQTTNSADIFSREICVKGPMMGIYLYFEFESKTFLFEETFTKILHFIQIQINRKSQVGKSRKTVWVYSPF